MVGLPREMRLCFAAGQHLQWEGTASLGPLLLEENGALLPDPATPLRTRGATPAGEETQAPSSPFCCGALTVMFVSRFLSLLFVDGPAVRSGRSAGCGGAGVHGCCHPQQTTQTLWTCCLYLIYGNKTFIIAKFLFFFH